MSGHGSPEPISQRSAVNPVAVGATIACILAASSCRSTDKPLVDHQLRDSAGIRIVESSGPEWRDGAGWALSSEPSVTIGSADGDEHYLFSRVTKGRLMPDGGFVLMDFGTMTLRRFSATGAFMWEAGREGDGPSEFRDPQVLQVLKPDSLLVFDTSSRQLSVISPSGDFVRSTPLRVPGILSPYIVAVAGTAEDGFVALTSGSSPITPGMGTAFGMRRPRAYFLAFGPNGDFVDTLLVLPGTEMSRTDLGGGRGEVAAPPYGHITSYAVRGPDIAVGTGDHLQVEIRDHTGEVRDIMRGPDRDLTLTEADVETYRRWYLERLPEERRAGRMFLLDAKIYPSEKAVYFYVHGDPEGNLWLGGGGPDYLIPDTWTVFSSDGRLLGEVRFPDDFRVLDVGSSAILGVWTDSLGVQHPQVYPIEK
jgi:hypothetical protein